MKKKKKNSEICPFCDGRIQGYFEDSWDGHEQWDECVDCYTAWFPDGRISYSELHVRIARFEHEFNSITQFLIAKFDRLRDRLIP